MKISAVILTHNNERTIENCILSIKHIVDEIIIVDDFSSDETLNIVSACKKVRLFQRELSNDFLANAILALDMRQMIGFYTSIQMNISRLDYKMKLLDCV